MRDDTKTIFEDIRGKDNFLLQPFRKEGDGAGSVSVLLFEDIERRNYAYDHIINEELETYGYTGKNELSEIGEKGYLYYQQLPYVGSEGTINFVTFVRCNAYVYMVKTWGGKETVVLLEYAKRLDKRLKETFCP